MPSGSLLARLTVRKPSQTLTIEVRSTAGFHDFYTWFHGKGRGRKFLKTSPRNDGAPYFHSPVGLAVIAARYQDRPGHTVKLTILKKKLYKKFLNMPADQLPGQRLARLNTSMDRLQPFAPRAYSFTILQRDRAEVR